MDFESNDEYEAWLKTQPQDVCLAIATRVALRVAPLVMFWKDTPQARQDQEELVLLTNWDRLSSGVAGTCPTPATFLAASLASRAVSRSASRAAVDSSFDAARAALYRDAGFSPENMFLQPLWHDSGPPIGLRPEDIGETIFETNQHFSFFERWHDGMLRGEPLDWELQRRVALIPQKTWEAGVEAVSQAIADIEA